MRTLILTALSSLLAFPSAASGAAVTADTERRGGTTFGPVTFKAALGEENLVTVSQANGLLRFHDAINVVRASGDCEQVDDHTASCPVTEDVAKVKLRDGLDSATVAGLVGVLGGSGRDFLTGSPGSDNLNGQAGRDTLTGGRGGDTLTGASGRDMLFGDRGDDDLIDGERDGNASPDVFAGGASRDTAGSDRGDRIVYSNRERGLHIDLSRKRHGIGPNHDDLAGIESVSGGSGDDRLLGDHDDNSLAGNGGDDILIGREGDDTLTGGGGEDNLAGRAGDDVVSGDAGTDELSGGVQDDLLIANDSAAETVRCNPGFDIARVTRLDTLKSCRVANSDPLYIIVRPQIRDDTATFQLACQQLDGCDGTLELSGPDAEDFGSGDFSDLPDDPETFTPVSVALTAAGVQALRDGAVVQVAHGDTGGYRAFMKSD
jgi:Ca2+-binding RTX toxin-like protein